MMMFLDDVIARLDGLREARKEGAGPEWGQDAEALSAALSTLRGFRLAAQRTIRPESEILWITPEQVEGLRVSVAEARCAVSAVKANLAALENGLGPCEAAERAINHLIGAENRIQEVKSHVGEAD